MKTRKPAIKSKNPTLHTRRNLILSYIMLTVLAVASISIPTMRQTNKILQNKVSSMLSTFTSQLVLNINTYLADHATYASFLFMDEDVYHYSHGQASEQDELRAEEKIKNSLHSIGLLQNYSDLFVVSRDNSVIGNISMHTRRQYGDALFSSFADALAEQGVTDTWLVNSCEDTTRLFYIKQVNENLLYIASIYTLEFENVLEAPSDLSSLKIRLAENDRIVYSTATEEIGEPLNDRIVSIISEHPNSTTISQDYLVSSANCKQNWTLICSIRSDQILSEMTQLTIYICTILVVILILCIVLAVVMSNKITTPLEQVIGSLHLRAEFDQLTHLLDKKTFEDHTAHHLATATAGSCGGFLLIDIDNFKTVNDTLGHAVGDEVLASIGVLLNSTFRQQDLKGRVGGDEFAVLLVTDGQSLEETKRIVQESCVRLFSSIKYLSNTFIEKTGRSDVVISASVGISFFWQDGRTFEELYRCADEALYISKRSGKNRYTLYHTEDELK